MNMLTVCGVSKRFGDHQVLQNLSFNVPENTIYGFVGENGAGKTTTMKMILGLMKMDEGEILVHDEKVEFGQTKTNQYVGYLPDVPEFYGFLTASEYLTMCGNLTFMKKEHCQQRVRMLLELVGLSQEKHRIHGFSRGMKQRLGIAQALLNEPKLLICDEPTSALDPVGRKEILDILKAIREKTTVIFSTHILTDVERICNEVGFLHQGQLMRQLTMEELHTKHSQGIGVWFRQEQERREAQDMLKQAGLSVIVGEENGLRIKDTKENMTLLLSLLAQQKVYPIRVEQLEPTLESIFLEVVSQ